MQKANIILMANFDKTAIYLGIIIVLGVVAFKIAKFGLKVLIKTLNQIIFMARIKKMEKNAQVNLQFLDELQKEINGVSTKKEIPSEKCEGATIQ